MTEYEISMAEYESLSKKIRLGEINGVNRTVDYVWLCLRGGSKRRANLVRKSGESHYEVQVMKNGKLRERYFIELSHIARLDALWKEHFGD